MIKKLLLSLMVISSISAQHVRFVVKNSQGQLHEVSEYNVPSLLKSIPADKLEKAMKHLVIRVAPLSNGEYKLYAHVKGLGGGPISAQVAYAGVWAGYAALCSTEGPVCAAHFTEFQVLANGAYWGLFFAPWCP